ncbi:phosphatase PAP2 family protein [Fodinisporobacter ferrooxydans]|uniref:Phosphatase PAP2 family protein n=1 Tax=Fodinisporobacter ferrooxydans TaxID=2901836 RepID=A0ABY4CJ26_9BACL|nr:phosphatase PAP2 family protein [Alicyclobacillaceae bacterium MYW30-H2]
MNVIRRIAAWDKRIFEKMTAEKSNTYKHVTRTDRFMILVARTSPIVMVAVILGIGILDVWNHQFVSALAVPACLAAGFLSRLMSGWISRLLPRDRPFLQFRKTPLIAHRPEESFPSNHAAGGFALATALIQFHPVYGIVYGVWAIVLAYSRLHVRLHFFSDVLAGAILGCMIGSFAGRLTFLALGSFAPG